MIAYIANNIGLANMSIFKIRTTLMTVVNAPAIELINGITLPITLNATNPTATALITGNKNPRF